MITVSNDVKSLVALVILIVLYEIVCLGIKGIIKDIKKNLKAHLDSIKADKWET